jgi:biopolymer transport protein ExbD/biopolymer transport protein TolR
MASKKIGGGAVYGGSSLPSIAGIGDSGVNGDINVTPMVDVMLVLLIIFMVITPALAGYVAILPKAITSEDEKDDRIELGIDRDGKFYLDEKPGAVPEDQLAARMTALYQFRPDDHVLYLKADTGVAFSVVLTAIDAARVAGVRRIGAITELPQPAESE